MHWTNKLSLNLACSVQLWQSSELRPFYQSISMPAFATLEAWETLATCEFYGWGLIELGSNPARVIYIIISYISRCISWSISTGSGMLSLVVLVLTTDSGYAEHWQLIPSPVLTESTAACSPLQLLTGWSKNFSCRRVLWFCAFLGTSYTWLKINNKNFNLKSMKVLPSLLKSCKTRLKLYESHACVAVPLSGIFI